jgi:DNA-directed RNA polymerase specialized sigma24 family protein
MTSRPAHFERLLKFLRRKGRSREDAEDLIQEAMLRLHIYGQEVPVTNEEAFLRHAVYNLSIDQHRRDRPERLGHIKAILDAVGLRTREIYFAHRGGYSYAEIATHLGISQITIKRHIARALLAIMEHGEMNDDGIAQRATE